MLCIYKKSPINSWGYEIELNRLLDKIFIEYNCNLLSHSTNYSLKVIHFITVIGKAFIECHLVFLVCDT